MTAVYLEAGAKRVFAGALDWPGWIRAGGDEKLALAALEAAAPRYAIAAAAAGVPFDPPDGFEVVERVRGNATTDFGAPGIAASRDAEPLTAAEAKQIAALVEASWSVLAKVAARAPAELRKGPRGGGRDRDQIVSHVLGAESAYASKLGIRVRQPDPDDEAAIAAMRNAIVDCLRNARAGEPVKDKGWLPRYAARRIAWHALDHAWEIEDRS